MNIWIEGTLKELADLVDVEEAALDTKAGTFASVRMFGSELRVKLSKILTKQKRTFLPLVIQSVKPDTVELSENIWDPDYGFVMQCNCPEWGLFQWGCQCGAAAMEKAAKTCPACGR